MSSSAVLSSAALFGLLEVRDISVVVEEGSVVETAAVGFDASLLIGPSFYFFRSTMHQIH